jgi:hypothetical protein
MRSSLVMALVLVAACDRGTPAPHTLTPPGLSKLGQMSEEQRCTAVAPRARPCVDELMRASLVSIGAGELAEAVKEDPGPTTAKDRDVMHALNCETDQDYPFAVVTCWKNCDCEAFATCVYKELAKTSRPERGR